MWLSLHIWAYSHFWVILYIGKRFFRLAKLAYFCMNGRTPQVPLLVSWGIRTCQRSCLYLKTLEIYTMLLPSCKQLYMGAERLSLKTHIYENLYDHYIQELMERGNAAYGVSANYIPLCSAVWGLMIPAEDGDCFRRSHVNRWKRTGHAVHSPCKINWATCINMCSTV